MLLRILIALLGLTAVAAAQTGASDDRVSLPDGPGSLEGLGENAQVHANMGTFAWSLPISVIPGFPGVTPELALSYSSSGGSGPVGMGWSLPLASIERGTWRSLPDYDVDDDFVADGAQLVRVAEAPSVWRARFEGGFVRYTWEALGDGRGGYWVAEYPDGRRAYFGARADGTLVPESRVTHPTGGGVFRYHLVEVVDVFGHSMVVNYQKDGEYALAQRIAYVFVDGQPRYEVTFRYEAQRDETGSSALSDARPGFDLRLTQRLAEVSVFSGGQRIRRYQLDYAPYAEAGGFTRLARVTRFGLRDEPLPIVFDFTYSQALGGACEGADCVAPQVVDLGVTGVDVGAGRATLIDINGDGLPDLLETPVQGRHRFFLNQPMEDGTSRFAAAPVVSAFGDDVFRLGEGPVQTLDVNGDGFADLLNTRTGAVLFNEGVGDWARQGEVADVGAVGGEGLEPGEDGQLIGVRFLDVDNDRRIDLMRSTRAETTILRNEGGGRYAALDGVEALGAGIVEDDLEFSDMNGDGLLDPISVRLGSVRYWLNLGHGRWAAPVDLPAPIANEEERRLSTLEDLNGDGLADLVLVVGTTVRYAINRNGSEFFEVVTLDRGDVQGELPERAQGVTVLVADMNANGSQDVVWMDRQGWARYLELFATRPNLLSRIENGIGWVMEVTYGTSVQHLARDGGTWATPLPHPMLVVDRTDTWDRLSNVHEINAYRYHDGFYDGREKQFRGYRTVEHIQGGDESHEAGRTLRTYNVGERDPYFHGRMEREVVESGDRTLRERVRAYEDCPVAEVPAGLERPVRHICEVAVEDVLKEGAEPAAWQTLRTTKRFDGYGNVVVESNEGVVGACAPCDRDPDVFGAPCGPECRGDERTVETEYVPPGDRWILGAPSRQREFGQLGGDVAETRTYYDGPPFVGLPLGALDQGRVTRVEVAADQDTFLRTMAVERDADGNVVRSLDALGDPDGADHQRRFVYDDEGLRVLSAEALLVDAQGAPYALRQETGYDPVFRRPNEQTDWMRVTAEGVSARRSQFVLYDAQGRVSARVLPGGDTVENPTETVTYELGDPTSRLVVRRRTQVGGALDLEAVRCLDGRGRVVQTRTRVATGRYQVDGLTRFNTRGEPVEVFQPYEAETADCDEAPPDGVASRTLTYDATHRLLEETEPDADLYGTATTTRRVYLPLRTQVWDGEDTDPESPFFDTPTTTALDGLGRIHALERVLDGETSVISATYDTLGRLRGYVDDAGNERVQTWDLAGRLVRVDDPNGGTTTFEYDDAGNVVEEVDGDGLVTAFRYDGQNRRVARWSAADEAATRVDWIWDLAPDCPADVCSNSEGRVAETRWPGLDGLPDRDRMGHDVRGRRVTTERTQGGVVWRQRQTWDNADRRVSTVYPDGREVRRRYDGASRVVGISDVLTELTYDARGLPAEATWQDGTRDVWAYDERMRLRALTTEGSAGVLQGFEYTRDRAGHLESIEDTGHAYGPGGGATLTRDAWYRTTEARFEGETASFEFDTLDNLTRKAGAGRQGVYAYDAGPNAVTAVDGLALEYDGSGRMTRRGEVAYTRDFLGRLTQAGTYRAFYGAGSERVAKIEDGSVTHYPMEDFEVRDGISSVRVRLSGRHVARLDSTALATTVLPDLNENEEIDAGDAVKATPDLTDGLLWSAVRRMHHDRSAETTILHGDHLGSLTLATADGVVVGQRAFYPTGEVRPGSFGFVDVRGFTGQEHDESTGLVHFRYRELDPETGRFTTPDPAFRALASVDPMRLAEAASAYAYVSNEFFDRVDPLGLAGERVQIGGHRANATVGGRFKPRVADAYRGRARREVRGFVKKGLERMAPSPKKTFEGINVRQRVVDNLTSFAFTVVQARVINRIEEHADQGLDTTEDQRLGEALNELWRDFETRQALQAGHDLASFQPVNARWNQAMPNRVSPRDGADSGDEVRDGPGYIDPGVSNYIPDPLGEQGAAAGP